MLHPLFNLLTMAYGSTAALAYAASWAGAPIWLAVLIFWIGGAGMVLVIAAARARIARSD